MASDIDLGIAGIGPATLLARGGSAFVYLAEQTDFGRAVAVKVLFDALEDEATIKRFDRECRAIGAVSSHPNIVVVHGRGLTADDRPYLVMEHRAGGSLAEQLAMRGRLTEAEVIRIGTKIGAALAVAHDAGVVHRDVKPANILLSAYNEPALADFGIARIDGGHKTTQGVFSASVLHASREVLDAGEPTARSDVYSLASTMFELVTGRAPFADPDDSSMWTVISRVLTEDAPDPAGLGVSPGLAAVLRRGLAHEPAARPHTAAAFVAELEALSARPHTSEPTAVNTAVAAPISGAPQGETSSMPVVGDTAKVPVRRRTGRRLVLAIGAAVVVLAALAGGAVAALRGDVFSSALEDDGQPDVTEPGPTPGSGGTAEVIDGDTDGPELRFPRAAIGPLRAGERYTLDLVPDVAEADAGFQIVVDGEPVTESQASIPVYFPTVGRHRVQIEITTTDRTITTDPVEVYVSGDGPDPGYRANLSSIRSNPDNWPEALRLYDRLVADGHVDLELTQSSRAEESGLPYWNFYVDGFGDDLDEARAYCEGFGLDTDNCFVARV